MNIIGDVAGRYKELLLLIYKMPKEEIILLGDLNDRGPDSDKVIQYAIDNNIKCVKSNHGDMFIGHYNKEHGTNYPCDNSMDNRYYHLLNGGHQTCTSYGGIDNVPEAHIKWLSELPWYIETEELFLSHAPWNPGLTIEQAANYKDIDNSLIWNREDPCRRDKFQIYGHNGTPWVSSDKKGDYAICIDSSFNRLLLGINWPSRVTYKQEYIDD